MGYWANLEVFNFLRLCFFQTEKKKIEGNIQSCGKDPEVKGLDFSILRNGLVRNTKSMVDGSCQTDKTFFPSFKTIENNREPFDLKTI